MAATKERIAFAGAVEIVKKDGSNPSLVFANGTTSSANPLQNLRVVDTTGEVRDFNAAYLAGGLQNEPPVQSVGYAHAIAAQVIADHGALIPPTISG